MDNEILSLKQNKQIVAILDAPEISLVEDEKAIDGLLNFYRALGGTVWIFLTRAKYEQLKLYMPGSLISCLKNALIL